jgi:hypothetical protein
MTHETNVAKEVVRAAVRWAGNILVEIGNNYGRRMNVTDQALLSTAIRCLKEISYLEFR